MKPMKKLPIGIQDFKYLIEHNYLYVDKTKYIYDLINRGKVYFMSRPRRFGKSLTISTLYYLFKGEKKLFENTWIYDKWDWQEKPVIRMSMSDTDSDTVALLKESLYENIEEIYREHNLEIDSKILKIAVKRLFSKLHDKYGKRVVVLIDEYDKPILDHLHNPEKAEKTREILRNFYSSFKDADPYIDFIMLTGITKFTKVGIFSTLNNLMDISTHFRYAQMMGYTQKELETHFNAYFEEATQLMTVKKNLLQTQIKNYYNGFSFDGKAFVYNPFSILNFFNSYTFSNYWIESGSPSFIINYAKTHQIKVNEIIGTYIQKDILNTYEIEEAPPVSFLLQAGYLTFKDRDDKKGYLIDYPNKEVRDAFSQLLMLSEYNLKDKTSNDIRLNINEGLETGNFEKIFLQMQRTLSNIPYNLFETREKYEMEDDFAKRRESFYHSVILTMFWAAGINVKAEELSNLGRSDLILEYEKDVYIIELKKQPAEVPIKGVLKKLQDDFGTKSSQIREKNYAGKYFYCWN
jgi:hypothetical protein